MRRFLIAAVLGVATFASMAADASANFTYNVSLSVPNSSTNLGFVKAVGTITVDALGSLSAPDVVSYSLVFTGSNLSTTLTQSNSGFIVTSGSLNASASVLTEILPPMNTSGNIFEIYGFSPNQQTSLIISGGNGAPGSLDIRAGNEFGARVLGSDGGPFIVGTTTSVPEPSSLILTGVGVLLTLKYATSRRQRAWAA